MTKDVGNQSIARTRTSKLKFHFCARFFGFSSIATPRANLLETTQKRRQIPSVFKELADANTIPIRVRCLELGQPVEHSFQTTRDNPLAAKLGESSQNRLPSSRKLLFTKAENSVPAEPHRAHFIEQVDRVERQASLLLRALHSIYVALAAFACATLTLLGASLAHFQEAIWLRLLAGFGVVLGFLGVGGLVVGCVNLFRATQISLVNIGEEAALIRGRQAQ